jgi:uncharacterized protein (DUF302 family)
MSTNASDAKSGIAAMPSPHSVDRTVERIEALLADRGVKLFAAIDHSGEAAAAGIPMHPTKLLLFGNPKAGTPVMVASPTAAIDLPLKILVYEDSDGRVWVAYNTLAYLKARHGIATELVQNLAVVEAIAAKAVE